MRRLDAILIGMVLVSLLFTAIRRRVIEMPGTVNAATHRSDQINQSEQVVVRAEGEVVTYPDAQVTVGAQASGELSSFKVRENEPVHRGELIAEINSSEQRAGLAQARAQLSEADVNLHYVTDELARTKTLAAAGVISKDEAERVERELGMARARRQTLAASVQRIEAALTKTRVYAPMDGTVIATYKAQGELVVAGAPLVTIANLSRVRVEAEVPEADSAPVRVGLRALITADGFPGASWRGVVEEVPASVVPRKLKPEDTMRPVQERVLMVKIALSQPVPIKLNQRVDVALVDDAQHGRSSHSLREAPSDP